MFATILLALTVAIAVGCTSTSTPGPNPTPTPTPTPTSTGPTPTPTPAPQNAISMIYTGSAPTADPTYGTINGYGVLASLPTATPASTPGPSQVITVTHGQTVVFFNFDHSGPHTASLLCRIPPAPCAALGMNWPPVFNNTNGASQASLAGTAITDPNFSTGAVGASAGAPVPSRIYSTGSLTGMFYFGDFYNYLSNPQMRTVIIIQ